MDAGWLSDVVLVNESGRAEVAGDVRIFRSMGEARRFIEPEWVRNNEGFAVTAAGEPLLLGVGDDGNVTSSRGSATVETRQLVICGLRAVAKLTHEIRVAWAEKDYLVLGEHESSGVLPDSVEGLLAYVGFDPSPMPVPTWYLLAKFALMLLAVLAAAMWSVWGLAFLW